MTGAGASGAGLSGATVYGSFANVTGAQATAIGVGATAGQGAIAIGTQQYTGGDPATGAPIGGTPTTASGLNSIALGTGATATANYAIAQGFGATAGAGGITTAGLPTGGIAIGTGAVAGNDVAGSTLAIGNYASATAPAANNTGDSVAIGTSTTANAVDSIAIGAQTTASATNTIAIGNNGTTNAGANSVVIGVASSASAAASGSVVLGSNSSATNANETVLGRGATSSAAGGVALGNGSVQVRAGLAGATEAFSQTAVTSTNGSVSVGSAGNERQITNLAGGTQATDAVNLRQLRAVGTNLATSLGGGAAFDPTTGAYTAPTYTVGAATYNNVGAAITALGASGGGTGVFASDNTAGALAPVATGANASAGGYGASATGAGSTSVGNGSTDNGNASAVAIGHNASVLGAGSIAIGDGTTANTSINQQTVADFRAGGLKQINNLPAGTTSMVPTGVAIGQLSTVGLKGGVAIGYNNNAGNTPGSSMSTAIGASNLASGNNSIALGMNNTASNSGSIAFGTDNQATGQRAIAIGRESYAYGDFSMAQGYLSSAYGTNSLAFGPNSVAGVNGGAATNDVAIGSGATSTLGNSVALGAGSVAGRGAETGYTGYGVGIQTSTGEVAVGTAAAPRTITGVSAGRLGTDAVNVSQLGAVGTNLATSLGGGAGFNATTGAYTAPAYTVGGQTYNDVGSALAAGNALAVQYTPNGAGAPTNVVDLTKGGTLAPVAMTGLANATTATGAVTLGQTPLQYSTAGAPTTANPAVPSNDVTLVGANAGAPVSLHNLAAGTLTATSTDAVNGSQLYGTAGSVATALGGGAGVNPDGTVSAPSYTVAGTAYNNVGSAIGAIDTGLTNGQVGAFRSNNTAGAANPVDTGADSVAGGFGASATGAASTVLGNGATDNGNAASTVVGNGASVAAGLAGSNVALGQGSTVAAAAVPTTGATIGGIGYTFAGGAPTGAVSVGAVGAERQIQNVAAGQLNAGSTDAVNGSQLFATNTQVTNNTTAIAGLTNGTAGLVQQAGPGAPITVGAGTDGTAVDFTNNGGAARTLNGVSAGNVAVGSTQAINGGQLFATSTSLATALGGGAGVNPDGTVSAPTYTVAGANYNNVGGAIGALDAGLANGQIGTFRSDNTAGAAAPVATGNNSVAGGFGSSATGAASTALGNGATDNGNANATVVGNGASVAAGLAGSNIALGQGTVAGRGAETNYAGYGVGTQTSAGELAVGTPTAARTITGVAAGRLATDAANVGQLQAVGTNLADSLGGGAGFDPVTGAYTAPTYSVAGINYNNVGGALSALDTGLANGQVGAFRSDNSAGAAAPVATGANSVAGGFGSSATGAGSTALGNGATDNGNANATVVGNGASVAAGLTGSNVALGQGSAANRGAQTAYNAFGLAAPQTSAGEVAVGTAAAPRQLTGVAAGSAATDAVNVAQLQGATSNLGTSTATALGGGSTYDAATGQVTAPSYSLNNGTQTFNNVGDALGNLDGRTTSNTNAIAGLQNGTSGIVQQAGAGAPITVGAATDGTVVNFRNNAAVARTLTGVAAGTVAAGSTDAVNGGQLAGTAGSVATALGGGAAVNADGTVSAPTYSVGGQNYNNVGGAITALDSTGVKYDTAPGGGKGQSITLAGGDPNQPVVIRNVAAGTARTDAANVGQVQDAETRANQYTNQRVAGLANEMAGVNDRLSGLESNIAETKREARQGAAIGLAAASLRYDDRPGKVSVAAGGGYWRGEAAGAFGLGYTLPDGRFRVNATVATTGTAVGAGAGATYTFN